ncbi:uracil-DNA glycosylase [Adhaeretor mobilis]|nr:uracil-DNA glycosylase [Adhaeretor mobilis]
MPDSMNVKRALEQQLASLAAAGVGQLPHVEYVPDPAARGLAAPKETVAPTPAPTPAKPQAAKPQALPSTQSVPIAPSGVAISRATTLPVLAEEVAACTLCGDLATTRTQTVFGVGNPAARLCLLGEAPGADEDAQGEPFVGRSGQLLTKILSACGLEREDVYILNILKCRPPGNRNPAPQESENCRQFLIRQLQLIEPEFICCLGAVAAQNLLETTTSIGRLRGQLHDYRGIKVLCTYHPAYLLRNPGAKKDCWEDMQLLMREMGTPVE